MGYNPYQHVCEWFDFERQKCLVVKRFLTTSGNFFYSKKLQNDHKKFETTAQVSENNLYVYIFWMLRVKKQLTQQVSTCKFRHACHNFSLFSKMQCLLMMLWLSLA
jgi:hypothetical protein